MEENEAILIEYSEDDKDDTILNLNVFQPGYQFHGSLLWPARVVVAKSGSKC
jgi:molecular chaperone GrpE (heat shock protein)